MIPQLTDHLWQSTVFTLAAGLLAVALRHNRAHMRYWLWFAASLKFFVPFAWLMFLGSQLALAPSAAPMASTAVPAVSFIMEPFAQTLAEAPPVELSAPPPPVAWIPMVLVGLWACGFVAIALLRLRGWRRIRAAVGASMPAEPPTAGSNVPVRSSFDVLEPGVVGCGVRFSCFQRASRRTSRRGNWRLCSRTRCVTCGGATISRRRST